MRTTDPYQATRPFNVESAPFDFASQGRDIGELLGNAEQRKTRRWEAPNYSFRESPEFKLDIDPITQQVRQFKQGAAEDDPIFGLLGSGLESSGEDPVDWSINTVKNWTKGKSPARVMGSIASSLPVEEVKAGLLGAKGLAGGVASLGAIVPTSGYRRDILKLGDLANRRFQLDTPDLEKRMKLLEAAAPEGTVTAFTNRLASPTGHKELEEILDLADVQAPEADITDEMARRMAVFGNSRAPARRGSFPGLAPVETPRPTGQTHQTREEIAGGPIVDYGRFNLGGINTKRVGASPSGFWLEKGGDMSRDDFGTDVRFPEPARDSARESAQTKIMELLQGDTPVAHQIYGGGTFQQFLPDSFKSWQHRDVNPYNGPSNVVNPEIANQLAAEQARDIFGGVVDRHTGQFMFDPAAKRVVGVDKGYGSADSYNFKGRLMPPEMQVGTPLDMYQAITKSGPMAGLVDPATYQDMAALGLSIPQSDWQRTLEPLMEANWITSQADKDTALRNYMRSIQDMPAHLDKYYRDFVKP